MRPRLVSAASIRAPRGRRPDPETLRALRRSRRGVLEAARSPTMSRALPASRCGTCSLTGEVSPCFNVESCLPLARSRSTSINTCASRPICSFVFLAHPSTPIDTVVRYWTGVVREVLPPTRSAGLGLLFYCRSLKRSTAALLLFFFMQSSPLVDQP